MTKKETTAIIWLVIIVAIVAGIVGFFEAVGYVLPIVVVAASGLLYWWYNANKKKKRLSYLRGKYKDEELIQKIYNGYMWQGQTLEQLIDSLGQPVAMDKKVLKTKKKEIWKYGHQGGNRFSLRITLEDDVVVGWDKKA